MWGQRPRANKTFAVHEMTPEVWSGMHIEYGSCRCWCCGKKLLPGDLWQWYVTHEQQRYEKNDLGKKLIGPDERVVPVYGCPDHEGEVVQVGAGLYRIGPAGEPAKRVGRVGVEACTG